MNEDVTINKFREIGQERLGFLGTKGFKRLSNLEETTTTFSTLVYLGNNVGLIFSFDARDQCIDLEIVKVRNGKVVRNSDGGYSSDLFTHLVKYHGYRGKGIDKIRKGNRTQNDNCSIESMFDSLISVLNTAGRFLYEDSQSTLP